jgi:hypothetical protein
MAARAQQPALPVIGFIFGGATDARYAAAFRKGLNETGYVESQNVMVEYHWLAQLAQWHDVNQHYGMSGMPPTPTESLRRTNTRVASRHHCLPGCSGRMRGRPCRHQQPVHGLTAFQARDDRFGTCIT